MADGNGGVKDTASNSLIDVAIIGAGPAGMTAALYGARAGLDCALFERISPGGQLATTEHLENYPGYMRSTSGFELALAMHEQALSFGARSISEEVISVDLTSDPKQLKTAFGAYQARSVIIATGSRPRLMGLPLEAELTGKGVSYCATCDGNFFRGREVAVVGGGNTAAADAIYLARICSKVHLIHRRDKLRATAIYHKRLEELENVVFHWDTVVDELLAEEGRLAALALRNVKSDERSVMPVDALFVAVGTLPNTEFLEGALELNEAGYVIADERGVTDIPGVYVAGDVRTKTLRQVVTAVADGAVCAEELAEFLG